MNSETRSKIITIVKEQVVLLDLVKSICGGGKVTGHNQHSFLSPFNEEKTPSFYVDPKKNTWVDFSASSSGQKTGGDVITFIQRYYNITRFDQVLSKALELGNIDLQAYGLSSEDLFPSDSTTEAKPQFTLEQKLILEINAVAQQYFTYQYKILRDHDSVMSNANFYAKSIRKYSDETIKEFGFGYADGDRRSLGTFMKLKGYTAEEIRTAGLTNEDGSDLYNDRLMVPIYDLKNNVIGWGARNIINNDVKYLNPPTTAVFEKFKVLFNDNRAFPSVKKSGGDIYVMEGFLDVVTASQFEIKNAVASMGTSFSEGDLARLLETSTTQYLCFDGDRAGISATLKVFAWALKYTKANVKAILIPDNQDPDEFLNNHGREEFLSLKNGAMNYLDYYLKVNENVNRDDISAMEEVKNMAFKILVESQFSSIFISHYFDKLAKFFGVDKLVVDADFANYTKTKPFFSLYFRADGNGALVPKYDYYNLSISGQMMNEALTYNPTQAEIAKPNIPLQKKAGEDYLTYDYSQVVSIFSMDKIIDNHVKSIFISGNFERLAHILKIKALNPFLNLRNCAWLDFLGFDQDYVLHSIPVDMLIEKGILKSNESALISIFGDKLSRGIPILTINFELFLRRYFVWPEMLTNANGQNIDIHQLSLMMLDYVDQGQNPTNINWCIHKFDQERLESGYAVFARKSMWKCAISADDNYQSFSDSAFNEYYLPSLLKVDGTDLPKLKNAYSELISMTTMNMINKDIDLSINIANSILAFVKDTSSKDYLEIMKNLFDSFDKVVPFAITCALQNKPTMTKEKKPKENEL
jgi:DNA primase catalytic core